MIYQNHIRLNRILAGITLLISFIVYYDTMAPTVSYWDCGEFIAVSYTLGVPHPPGSPLFLLLGRIASMFPISEDIAFRVNILSPIVSAFSIMFLYLIIVQVVTQWRGHINSSRDALVAFGAGIVGSLTFAFTDSHWFNAVEAEVYAFSTFFTAIVVWLILAWNENADNDGNERYILTIAYMIGLATGLHLLNLLTLPFVALIMYFRKYNFKWSTFGITVAITGAVFFVIHNVIIKGMPKIAASIGVLLTGVLIISVFMGVVWAIKNRNTLFSLVLASMVLILIGYSTYALIFIRSNQNPGIDENDPETVEAFISYLEREQYGEVGIFPRRFNGIKPIHEVVGYPEGPGRQFSSSQESDYRSHESKKQWSFFWDYQIRKMYNRYFLWQFGGRGPASNSSVIPMGAIKREDGIDLSQFGLPLAFFLGIFGMFYHAYRDEKMAFSVMSLFIMTGYAIILYLNQDDPQPRERDYSYVGSFFAFSIWIGVGTAAISELITKHVENKQLSKRFIVIALVMQIIFMPMVMARANYHSHDRSGNFVAWDYSYNILQSCEPNGVIFTNGDNDTFPLWYLQEVEKVRTDVAVVNLSLLNTPWYIKQWRDKRSGENRFINLSDRQIDRLTSSLMRWPKDFNKFKKLTIELDSLKALDKKQKVLFQNQIQLLKEKIQALQTVKVPVYGDPKNELGYIEWVVKPTYGGQALRVQDMMILHIIDEAGWKVPIYFAVTVSGQNRIGLDEYMDMQGLTFQLKSHKTDNFDLEKMFENLMTDIGTPYWSTNFNHEDFYITSDSLNNKSSHIESGEEYLTWSREYQPGYMFRNLGNEKVYYNNQTQRLLQNYRSAYIQLAQMYYMEYERKNRKKKNRSEKELATLKEKIIIVLDKMDQKIPGDVIPIQSEALQYQIALIYGDLDEKNSMKNILETLISRKNGKPLNKVNYANTFYKEFNDAQTAINVLVDLKEDYSQKERIVLSQGFGNKTVRKGEWSRWEKAYPEIISSLVFIYKANNQFSEAEALLAEWVQRNPLDDNAKKILQEIRSGK